MRLYFLSVNYITDQDILNQKYEVNFYLGFAEYRYISLRTRQLVVNSSSRFPRPIVRFVSRVKLRVITQWVGGASFYILIYEATIFARLCREVSQKHRQHRGIPFFRNATCRPLAVFLLRHYHRVASNRKICFVRRVINGDRRKRERKRPACARTRVFAVHRRDRKAFGAMGMENLPGGALASRSRPQSL